MDEEKRKLIKSFIVPASFVALMWAVKLFEVLLSLDLSSFGIYPGKTSGLIGIITSPLIHADFNHLISNSIPMLFLGTGILYFYKESAFILFGIIYFIPSVFVWFFARPSYHIGASGLIYGFVAFLYFSGIIRRDTRSIALALIVTFLYGSLVWGILPLTNGISWESHLFGSIMGIVCAFILRKQDPAKKYDWEDEELDENEKPEISYKKGYPFDNSQMK